MHCVLDREDGLFERLPLCIAELEIARQHGKERLGEVAKAA
jgi:hypothetical protein